MNLRTLWRANLSFHRRAHVGLLAGCAVATATLVGALAVGDSVRGTLESRATQRLGAVDLALDAGDRFLRDATAQALSGVEGARCAPVLRVAATAAAADGSRRVHGVRVLGVDRRFFDLAPRAAELAQPAAGEALVGDAFAERMQLAAGDTVVVRVERPSALPRDMALAPDDSVLALRLVVRGRVGPDALGPFALTTSPAPASNVFVDLAWLQGELGVPGRVNLALADVRATGAAELAAAARALDASLAERWTLEDAGVRVATLSDGSREWTSDRVFFDQPIADLLSSAPALAEVPRTAVFTYFVEALRSGGRETPYSMVAAIGPLGPRAGAFPGDPIVLEATAGLAAGELRLNGWATDDLGARPGDDVELVYQAVDAARRLVERRRTFRLAEGAVAIEGSAAGRELMPAFPGLADAESCREWEPGTPVELERIRDKDERYWEDFRGTPKAFVTLEDGRAMWSGRFGELTALRCAPEHEERVRGALLTGLEPQALGLFWRDVRTPAALAGDSSTDFGGLFLGLSFLLVVAALLLATQLFLFGLDSRLGEVGLLFAVGLPRATIARLLMSETAAIAALGAALGVPLGLLYTALVLRGLDTVWSDAVAGLQLAFHASPGTIALGFLSALFATLVPVGWVLWRRLGQATLGLLTRRAGAEPPPPPVRPWRSLAVVGVALLLAALVFLLVDAGGGARAALSYFGAGAAVLTAGLVAARLLLRFPRPAGAWGLASVARLGALNATRRPSRSLATVALMGMGVFLVVAVGANRQGPVRDTQRRSSGTGGFALYGTSSLAVAQDLSSGTGREFFALSEADMEGVSFVPLRVLEGDEASCLSLARASAPRLLGVDPEELARRGAFAFHSVDESVAAGERATWDVLERDLGPDVVPAVGDLVSLTWQLKKAVGDELEYTDERGRPFRVRIVAALQDSVLQGDLVVSARALQERYPTQGGARAFLIDAPPERAEAVAAVLTRALSDVGLALESTGARLDTFHSVQNAYLNVFQVLGALGVLLGSVGLGMVVLRNTLERRGELALAAAVGFDAASLRRLVFVEYGGLLLLGLLAGGAAGFVASVPVLASDAGGGGAATIAGLLTLLALNGLAWIALATRGVGARAAPAALRLE